MIWYPVMAKLDLTTLLQQLEDHAIPGILQTEFCLYPDDNPSGLNGSGLLFINPPWQLDTQLAGLLPWLWHALTSDGGGRYKVEWLTAG
jgi:23S rRNA (adenine2030-N6)-methyltransferase